MTNTNTAINTEFHEDSNIPTLIKSAEKTLSSGLIKSISKVLFLGLPIAIALLPNDSNAGTVIDNCPKLEKKHEKRYDQIKKEGYKAIKNRKNKEWDFYPCGGHLKLLLQFEDDGTSNIGIIELYNDGRFDVGEIRSPANKDDIDYFLDVGIKFNHIPKL